jgi:hypothetical protein
VSYALYEDRLLDARADGRSIPNIDQYKIVGSREVPKIEVIVIEQLGGQSSTDARGVAEPANVATAAAVANAFYNATGKRIRTLPDEPRQRAGGAAGLKGVRLMRDTQADRRGRRPWLWIPAAGVAAVALLTGPVAHLAGEEGKPRATGRRPPTSSGWSTTTAASG